MEDDEQDTQVTIEAVDFHRNGVMGYPFIVAIVHNADGRMLVIDFGGSDEGEEVDPTADTCIAVLNLDEAAKGNIFMRPQMSEDGSEVPGTGYNAHRGDELSGAFRPAIAAALKAKVDREMARYLADRDAKSEKPGAPAESSD